MIKSTQGPGSAAYGCNRLNLPERLGEAIKALHMYMIELQKSIKESLDVHKDKEFDSASLSQNTGSSSLEKKLEEALEIMTEQDKLLQESIRGPAKQCHYQQNMELMAEYEERRKFDLEEIDRVRQHLGLKRKNLQIQAEKLDQNADTGEIRAATAI